VTAFPPATAVGDNWALHDRFNAAFNASGAVHGAPPNLLKAMVHRESGGVYPPSEEPSDVYCETRKKPDGSCNLILGFVGMFETTAAYEGCDPFPSMVGRPDRQIDCMARTLARLARDYGGWLNAATVYFGGVRALAEVVIDENGMRSDVYAGKVLADWQALDRRSQGGNTVAPTIYDLRNDYARFGLTKAQANTILAKHSSRAGSAPGWIVIHVQQGNTPGSLEHWLPRDASATVTIQQDGSILRIIDESLRPWTNGDDKNPNARGKPAVDAGDGDANRVSLTAEFEGTTNGPHTEAQLDAGAWQVRQWMDRYSIVLDRVIRHSDINTVDPEKVICPGPLYDRLMQRLRGPVPPQPPPPAPPGVPLVGNDLLLPPEIAPARAKAQMGTVSTARGTYGYTSNGSLAKLWVERGNRSGNWSRIDRVEDATFPRFYHFANGDIAVWPAQDQKIRWLTKPS
jgi:hypothetical protein